MIPRSSSRPHLLRPCPCPADDDSPSKSPVLRLSESRMPLRHSADKHARSARVVIAYSMNPSVSCVLGIGHPRPLPYPSRFVRR